MKLALEIKSSPIKVTEFLLQLMSSSDDCLNAMEIEIRPSSQLLLTDASFTMEIYKEKDLVNLAKMLTKAGILD